jgi:hypothetical protein
VSQFLELLRDEAFVPKGVAFQIDSWNFELTLFAFDTKSHLFRPFSCIMNSF